MSRLATFGVTLLLGLALACVTDRRVEDELEDANYCDINEDCLVIEPGCPFASYAAINKAEEANLKKLLERYRRQHRDCMNEYEAAGGTYCLHGSCILSEPFHDTL